MVSWNEWFLNWIYLILDRFSPSLRNFLKVRIFTLETGPRGNIKFWKTFVANSSSLDISAIVKTNKLTLRNPQGFFESFLSIQVNFWTLKGLFLFNCSALTDLLGQPHCCPTKACKESWVKQLTRFDSRTLTARILLSKVLFFINKRTRLWL